MPTDVEPLSPITENPEVSHAQAEIARLKARLEREIARRTEAEAVALAEYRAIHDKQAELSLLATIARSSNEAHTLESAFSAALEGICQFTGWDLGHAYRIDPDVEGDGIASMGLWFLSDIMRFTPLRVATEAPTFQASLDLPGRVLATGKAALISSLKDDPDSPRQDEAEICGIRSGYAIPVLAAQKTVAILEFFSSRTIDASEPFLEIAPQISAQLGRVVERHASDQALRQAHLELEKKVVERTQELAKTIEELNRRIEEQRRTEQSLLVHEQAIEAVANGIVITDATVPGNPIIYSNPAFACMTGYTAGDLIGKNCACLQGPDTDPEAVAELERAIASATHASVVIRHYRKDGTAFWNRLSLSPVIGPEGEALHFIALGEDVTEEKKANEMMLQAKAATDEANAALARAARLKDEFLAAMSHELRTPLNGILGLSESLRENIYGDLSDRQRGALSTIEESGRHLLALINDILDLSKIEAGKLELEIQPTDPTATTQTSLRFIKELAQRKSITVQFNAAPGTTAVLADPRRLKQMLVNLLSNAVKFTPEFGQIGVTLAPEPNSEQLRITVWDTGIGIAKEDLAKLFRPFIQIDSRLSRRYDGSGLGLALVRHMAELQKGTVELESEVGRGSRFSLLLPRVAGEGASTANPLELPSAPAAAKPSGPAASLGTILIAEDNDTNRRMYGDFLSARNFRIVTALDGLEAIAQVQLHRPDLVLMDVQMPNMDGFTAIQRIRSDPSSARVPIIALTALAMTGDRERCLAAGADGYLSKPVSLRTLEAKVRETLALKPTA